MKENAKGLESFPDILTVMELKRILRYRSRASIYTC